MPINLDTKNILTLIKDNTFQKITAVVFLCSLFFYLGRLSMPECRQDVVCHDIIKDRDLLSQQLVKERTSCQKEKVSDLKKLTEKLNTDCAMRVDNAIGHCEFSEDIHCPICVARGVCLQ